MDIREFTNSLFGAMTVLVDTDTKEPWFFGTEVAIYLGYSNVWDAISKHVDAEDIRKYTFKECPVEDRTRIWGPSDFRAKILINESGMYALAFSSRLPAAKDFRRWVTHTVLPEIRSNGGYILGQEDLDPKEMKELRANVHALSEKVVYLRKRRRELRTEVSQLRQDKRDLKQKNKMFRSEAAEQMAYYIRLIQECAELEDEIQRMKNILHVRTIKKTSEESEAEKAKEQMYTVDREGFIVIKKNIF